MMVSNWSCQRTGRFVGFLILAMLLIVLSACAAPPTPTPMPTITPTPLPTKVPTPSPTQTAYQYLGSPGCDGFTVLSERITFSWEDIEEFLDSGSWGYYRCAGNAAETAAFYRQKMIQPQYNWQEFNWVEQPQGTLGVYFHTAYQEWMYLWFLPGSGVSGSNLVSAVREISDPMDLPCCK